MALLFIISIFHLHKFLLSIIKLKYQKSCLPSRNILFSNILITIKIVLLISSCSFHFSWCFCAMHNFNNKWVLQASQSLEFLWYYNFENVLPLKESLWCPLQDKINITGYGTAGICDIIQNWLLSLILLKIQSYQENVEI